MTGVLRDDDDHRWPPACLPYLTPSPPHRSRLRGRELGGRTRPDLPEGSRWEIDMITGSSRQSRSIKYPDTGPGLCQAVSTLSLSLFICLRNIETGLWTTNNHANLIKTNCSSLQSVVSFGMIITKGGTRYDDPL